MEIKLAKNEKLLKRLLLINPVICETTTIPSTTPSTILKSVPHAMNLAPGVPMEKNNEKETEDNTYLNKTPQELDYLANLIQIPSVGYLKYDRFKQNIK